jgi:hypothetical protein
MKIYGGRTKVWFVRSEFKAPATLSPEKWIIFSVFPEGDYVTILMHDNK